MNLNFMSWERKKHLFYRLLNKAQPFYFLLNMLAVVANLVGYWNYAELINKAVLFSLILLMLFATGIFSLTSVIQLFSATETADKSLIIKAYKKGNLQMALSKPNDQCNDPMVHFHAALILS